MRSTVAALGLILLATATAAPAAIIGVPLGTGAPPATLGPYAMTPFPDDARPVINDVSSVPSPLGGDVGFSIPLSHREIGNGWATWSHGYTGDVYFTSGATAVTLHLPQLSGGPDTGAFYLYAEPDPFQTFTIRATATDGTFIEQDVAGFQGAAGYAFYTDGPGLASIDVTSSIGFAVGEFGIAAPPIPAPSAILLGAIGAGLVGRLRRRRAL